MVITGRCQRFWCSSDGGRRRSTQFNEMSTIHKARALERESFEIDYPLRQGSRFSNPVISHCEFWR